MISKRIFTKKGKIIKLDDLGTGQSQSAYLTGLLSSDDKRKMIVLFDEVAMMDSISLKPVYDKLTSLYKQNKLLCGIIIQKADKMRVKSLL